MSETQLSVPILPELDKGTISLHLSPEMDRPTLRKYFLPSDLKLLKLVATELCTYHNRL